jgi:hypothetical protein
LRSDLDLILEEIRGVIVFVSDSDLHRLTIRESFLIEDDHFEGILTWFYQLWYGD